MSKGKHIEGSNYILGVIVVITLAVAFAAMVSLAQNVRNEQTLENLQQQTQGLQADIQQLKSPSPTTSATPAATSTPSATVSPATSSY